MARVLMLDDDPVVLYVAEAALAAAGHVVVTGTDPSRAVALAVEHAVDAIVLDVNMPELSGFETLDALRAHPRTGGLPILFLSSLGASQDRVRGLRHGANDYLAKPFEPEELVLRVEQLAARRRDLGGDSGALAPELDKALTAGEIVGEVYLGRYRMLEVEGRGAMGVVFRGWDTRLKRPVALKTIRSERLLLEGDPDGLQAKLLDEATTLARFNHPNIVLVYDVESTADVVYVVMEYVDGVSLSGHLKKHRKLPAEQVIGLAAGVARGLGAAHDNGVIHRDVKPGNILLGSNHAVKVTDFGLAELASALSEKSSLVYGTPGFVPPEGLRGESYTEAGDLFGLGAVAYLCLTGRPAFDGDTVQKRMLNTLKTEPPPPHFVEPAVPRPVSHLVLDLLQKDPAARPASAREVEERLRGLSDREPRWTLADRDEEPAVAAAPSESSSTPVDRRRRQR